MTITFNPKHFIILGVLLALGFSGYYFREDVKQLFVSGAEKTVDDALKYLKNQKTEEVPNHRELFGTNFTDSLLDEHSFFKIDEWKLKSKSIGSDIYNVEVKGSVINGFGAKGERTPTFIVEKQNGKWVITDCIDFFVFDKLKDVYGKTDLQKNRLLVEIKTNVKIEKWSFSSTGYGGSIEGHGTVVNNSSRPVSFIKFKLEYRDRSDRVTNTDETYAIGGDELLPGQRRKFTWYTSSCYDCVTASYKLIFE